MFKFFSLAVGVLASNTKTIEVPLRKRNKNNSYQQQPPNSVVSDGVL
jgi:hypothetical protein